MTRAYLSWFGHRRAATSRPLACSGTGGPERRGRRSPLQQDRRRPPPRGPWEFGGLPRCNSFSVWARAAAPALPGVVSARSCHRFSPSGPSLGYSGVACCLSDVAQETDSLFYCSCSTNRRSFVIVPRAF